MQTERFRTRPWIFRGCLHAHQYWWNRLNTWAKVNTNEKRVMQHQTQKGVASAPTHQVMHAGSFSNSANYLHLQSRERSGE